ncbi:hypothetical protein DM860_006866 [Cuscuta australis]|uniref:RNA polymerase II-associated protein 1 C-terminal domain-containing protein n=1 Tax=Cuscuta australis TaxID=267555 RepID=A0A328E5A4_9ASTE|nr:hypothetical protein DM860_006866 [Cuscuta australis]
MEKQSRGRNLTPKLCLSQTNGDDASSLVGGIVEKGFSDQLHSKGTPVFSIAPPRPAVRPFPIARHRSHGPHWKPKIEDVNDDGEEVENEMEEDDLKGLDKVGAFAKPVKRKDKKGLDFSSWREAADGRSSSRMRKKEEDDDHYISSIERRNFTVQFESAGNLNGGLKSQDLTMPDKESQEQEHSVSDMAIDGQEGHMDVLPNGLTTLSEDIQVDIGEDLMSLEGQIDVENRARLAGMSADEILEARAEILAKLSPSGIEALRRRGLNKLKRQNIPSLGTHSIREKDNDQNEKSMMNTAVSSATVNSNPGSNPIPKEKDSKLGGNIPNSLPAKTGLWDAWSKRVERVRELRFSMDGNIVGNDAKVTDKIEDTVPSSSDYSPDNVAERDFLRTEGDPGAAGYTIKEAVALTRSVIPGQRALALRLIASVINKAINGIFQNQLGHTLNYIVTDGSVDWEAIWAFALGPEPELALSLRICLDDNHKSVVLACAKVIQSVLTYDINESFFDIAERIPNYQADIPTAPVFRSRPEIDGGFLHGGFWKYSTKPSNILTSAQNSFANKPEDEHSIQDDVMIAGQDIAAGLVRMGILQRICYLLEMDPSAPLEECSMSILIAIARHSPTCANAIMNCKSLVQVIVNRFVEIDPMEINPSKIKSVTLLQILARFSKKNCSEFVKNRIFLKMTLHLYCNSSSLDQWIKRGTEACKFSSALLVEQLRFWKVCIHYGYCVSHFSNLFPALCIWLTFPSFEKLIEQNVVNEYVMVAKEAFLVLGSLSKRLPNFYSHQMDAIMEDDDTENWSWSNVGPLIDSSLEWIVIKNIPYISSLLQCQNDEKECDIINSLLWLISSVLHMLSGVLEAVIPPEDSKILVNGSLPWLPEFVPKIGSEIIKNGFFSFSGGTDGTYKVTRSFIECMCLLRLNAGLETSIASTCCLQGVIWAVTFVDRLISLPKCKILNASSICIKTLSPEDRVLSGGIVQSCLPELGHLMMNLVESIEHKWRPIHLVETFGRGGPAPGIGVGWGASGGGFWSKLVLSAEVDGLLIAHLLDILPIVSLENQLSTLNKEIMCSVIQRINSTMATCLVVGPKGQYVIDKLFGILFQAPVLKSLDFITRQLIDLNKCLKPFEREYSEEEYLLFSNVLASHFRNRWLGSKKKPKPEISRSSLETIPEETDVSSLVTPGPAALVVEWARQRLPLPLHWFLSSLSAIPCSKNSSDTAGFLEVAKGGLFFLFGIEAASNFFGAVSSESPSGIPGGPLLYVPIIWKLHALSILLLTGTGILEDGNSRVAYENLQGIYGQLLDAQGRTEVKSLNFQSEIHDSYSTFIETLVEQFAAVSYGDLIFGRQVAFYLHRPVEASVRLATWRALCSAFALELLPPLDKCISAADGYLEPVEDDERILEVYIKSWVSGSLDRASTRSSASFTIALHHLSTTVFKTCTHHTLPLRNKLARSLLRDYSRNQQHEGMMISLVQYEKPEACLRPETDGEYLSRRKCETENRLEKLREACEGNSSMLRVVEKLGSAISKKLSW